MHFPYFSPLSGSVVLLPLASFFEVCGVSIRCSILDPWLLTAPLILFFPVDPNPLTQYVGCHLTRSEPIIFVIWVLLLLYDTGAAVIIYRTRQSTICWNLNCVQVMLILIAIPALRICELLSMLIRVSNFSEMIQIDRQVDPVSWKLYIEMVSPIYKLLFSPK